jgi:hypothetical protein
VQAGKLVLPRKDPPSRGGELVQTLPNHPLGAAYYAQTASDSTGAPSGTVHFRELLAILFPRPGRHHHAVASSVWLHHMPEHEGGGWHGDFWGG